MIPWGGISCCLSAAALYLLGRSSGRQASLRFSIWVSDFDSFFFVLIYIYFFWLGGCRDAEALNSVTRVHQLKDLGTCIENFVFIRTFRFSSVWLLGKGCKII